MSDMLQQATMQAYQCDTLIRILMQRTNSQEVKKSDRLVLKSLVNGMSPDISIKLLEESKNAIYETLNKFLAMNPTPEEQARIQDLKNEIHYSNSWDELSSLISHAIEITSRWS